MAELLRKNENGTGWLPVSIENLNILLSKAINQIEGFQHDYALRKNIAYNLQYLEFIDRCLSDLKMTTVMRTQNWKIFILVGCGVIESILSYLLIKKRLYAKTQYKLSCITSGNEKDLLGRKIKVDNYIYEKLPAAIREEMNFDAMLKKAESKQVLGTVSNLYPRLKHLRKLRNRIHIQEIGGPTDTDWNSFQYDDLCAMAEVLHSIFTGNIFKPTDEEKRYFDYLKKYLPV